MQLISNNRRRAKMHINEIRYLIAGLAAIFTTTALPVSGQTDVQPPRQPVMSREPRGDIPHLEQPLELKTELTALTEGSLEERVDKLKRKVLKDLVFVEGGSFMMGDFGPWWSPEKLYYTSRLDNKPPRKVTLTSYSIARFKTTYAEFDVFADATGQLRGGMDRKPGPELPRGHYRHPVVPVGLYWQRAKDYCQWLGKQTGVPFDLPTEAQWEYAARSRGQNFIWATDNGHIDIGRNVPGWQQEQKLRPIIWQDPHEPGRYDRTALFPVGIFPPNPLGLYDMNANGWEWMRDWYDPEWFRHSPEHDPKGPPTGTLRSLRGYADGDYIAGLNFIRFKRDPMVAGKDITTGVFGPGLNVTHSVRCVVNADHTIEAVSASMHPTISAR